MEFNAIEQKLATEINVSQPGFLEFYKAWKAEEQRKATMAGLAIVGVIFAILLAGLASSSSKSDDEKIRDAVDDELNRRGQ